MVEPGGSRIIPEIPGWNRKKNAFVNELDDRNPLVPPDHLLLDSVPDIGPIISRWELEKFKDC
jgi:hypothetical protein